jgi:hypothetical protein
MPPEEKGTTDWKARDKETYSSAITKKMINLGIESREDGTGEYYEDAVLDFWTDIPSVEKHRLIPKTLVGKLLYPGITVEEGDTPMIVFIRIMEKFPPSKDPKDLNHRKRIFAIKQLTVNVYDEMEILRGRHRRSSATTDDAEKLIEGWLE